MGLPTMSYMLETLHVQQSLEFRWHCYGYDYCSLFTDDMYEEDGKRADKFMRMIEPIASSVPYMVCHGNHGTVCL